MNAYSIYQYDELLGNVSLRQGKLSTSSKEVDNVLRAVNTGLAPEELIKQLPRLLHGVIHVRPLGESNILYDDGVEVEEPEALTQRDNELEEFVREYAPAVVDGYKGVWRTIHGRHVFIREGETPSDAVRRSIARKSAMSKKRHKPVDSAKLDMSTKAEYLVTEALKVAGVNPKWLSEIFVHSEFDVSIGSSLIEVKGIIDSENQKVNMKPAAVLRKKIFLLTHPGKVGHTIGVDLRGAKPQFYYKHGVGAYNLRAMKKVSAAGLAAAIKAGVPAAKEFLEGLELGKLKKKLAMLKRQGKDQGGAQSGRNLRRLPR